MRADTLTLRADDGAEIFVYRWLPEPVTPVRGIVQVAHGMAEHAARYAPLAERLTAAGWAVWASDHRGHGKTAPDEAHLGHFADEAGWSRVVADMRMVSKTARREHPGVPFVLFGHSMGSFLSQTLVLAHPQEIDALILSGTNIGGGALVSAGKQIAKVERMRSGRLGKSALLSKMSFGSYNKGFEGRTEFDWLSRDPLEVDKYVADPKCGFRVTNQTWVDLLGALEELGGGEWGRLPKDLPVYVFAGARDPVGAQGRGVRKLVEALKRGGLTNVTERIYADARHEMLNEINREEVLDGIAAWLDENVRAR